MTSALKAATLSLVVALGAGSAACAATVASVDVPWGQFDGIIHEVAEAGDYTLDFSGTGIFPGAPGYLGTAAYIFAEVEGGLDDLLASLGGGVTFVAMNGTSISLGFLAAGTDFAAGILTLGGNATMSLTRIDDTQPAPVPLPATLPLLAFAVGGAGLAAHRRKAA